MERLQFELECGGGVVAATAAAPVVVGVVSSGNLEVLVEVGGPPGRCRFTVDTSARGFGETWRAVLEDFAARQHPAGLVISVNDGGATPAVVSLRLDQAVEEFRGGAR
jgi:malonate decarboxylase delta subunit